MSLIIGVDVDDVVWDATSRWYKWKEQVRSFDEKLRDGWSLAYWRQENLYDDYSPYVEAMDLLEKLHNQGHKIVFVSHIKGNHHKSKVYRLKHFFPYMHGFIGTKEKFLVNVDVMIDDKMSNLEDFNNNGRHEVLKLFFKTPYNEFKTEHEDIFLCNSWKDVYNEIQAW